jgi:hypothetical protein
MLISNKNFIYIFEGVKKSKMLQKETILEELCNVLRSASLWEAGSRSASKWKAIFGSGSASKLKTGSGPASKRIVLEY